MIVITSHYSKEDETRELAAIDAAAKRILASKKLTREFLRKLGLDGNRPDQRAKSASRSSKTPLTGKVKARRPGA